MAASFLNHEDSRWSTGRPQRGSSRVGCEPGVVRAASRAPDREENEVRAIMVVLSAVGLSMTGWGTLAGAVTRAVAPDGSGEYPTIQAAIDACDSLDVVELLDGVYTGPGNRNLDFGGRTITVRSRSNDPRACVLDCEGEDLSIGEARRGFLFHSGEGPEAVVRGLTITRGISGGD